MLKRDRVIVPLDVIAHHRGGVLHAVEPLGAGTPEGQIQRVAEDDEHRHAIAPGVVNRHGSVLQSDSPMRQDKKRLAFDLGVAMRHCHRRFLMAAGDELGTLISAVVEQRFVERAEAGTRIRADVLKAERLDDVDHEVRSGALIFEDLDVGGHYALGFLGHQRRGGTGRKLGDLLLWLLRFGCSGTSHQGGGSRARASQKIPAAYRRFLRFSRRAGISILPLHTSVLYTRSGSI